MARKRKTEPEVVWKGPAALRPHLAPLDELREDDGNANTHDDRSIEAIKDSYHRFSQQKPLVVDGAGVVRAGNGQLQAARLLGWTHIAVVESDLEGMELALFALADNKTSSLSGFDPTRLQATLREAQRLEVPVCDLGWQPSEMEPLLHRDWTPPPSDATRAASDAPPVPMGDPVRLTVEQRQTFDAAVARMREMAQGVETSEGQVAELLAADWLSGNGHVGEPLPGADR